MSTYKCRANNPNTCRYHGSIHVHREQLKETYANYRSVMIAHLGKKFPLDYGSAALVEKASDAYDLARATVDAHDEEFAKLQKQLEDLNYAAEGENPDTMDEGYWVEHTDISERIDQAQAIRAARANENNPHGLGYVADTPHDFKEANKILKLNNCGEFTGVIAGEPDGNQETLIIVGTEGYYKVGVKTKKLLSVGTLKTVNSPAAPIELNGNPALKGDNLRYRKEFTDGKVTGYTVYSDKVCYQVSDKGAVRITTGLLSLE